MDIAALKTAANAEIASMAEQIDKGRLVSRLTMGVGVLVIALGVMGSNWFVAGEVTPYMWGIVTGLGVGIIGCGFVFGESISKMASLKTKLATVLGYL
jgi:hypothetical protein